MIDLNQFAGEVHQNAVAHGFYDPAPSDAELIAAIHSEISEAFEEWRAGRPMVYHECVLDLWCDGNGCSDGFDPNDECKYRDPEPHGIAVELIDVVLRGQPDLAADRRSHALPPPIRRADAPARAGSAGISDCEMIKLYAETDGKLMTKVDGAHKRDYNWD